MCLFCWEDHSWNLFMVLIYTIVQMHFFVDKNKNVNFPTNSQINFDYIIYYSISEICFEWTYNCSQYLKCTESLTYFHFYPKNALMPVTMSFIQENIFSVGWLLNVMICIEKFMLLSMYLAPEVSLVWLDSVVIPAILTFVNPLAYVSHT